VGLPDFEDIAPASSIFLYHFFDSFTPHAVGYGDAFFFIGYSHEDNALFFLLGLRLCFALGTRHLNVLLLLLGFVGLPLFVFTHEVFRWMKWCLGGKL
jgi:hypothetical protein